MQVAPQAPAAARLMDGLRRAPDALPPLRLEVAEGAGGSDVIRCRWGGRKWRFTAVPMAVVTPRRLVASLALARAATPAGPPPMVVAGHLSGREIDRIEAAGASGVDLCGNGVVQVPGELLVRRSGRPDTRGKGGNRTGAGRPAIRNAYRGTSGQVARLFLLRPLFDTAGGVRRGVLARGGGVSAGTVSKVMATLAEDLVIERVGRGGGRLIDPAELARRLAGSYRPVAVEVERVFRWRGGGGEGDLASAAADTGLRLVLDGRSSAAGYAALADDRPPRFYCDDLQRLAAAAADLIEPADRYEDFLLAETADPLAFFDARPPADGAALASPVQAWLELRAGDAREAAVAAQVLDRLTADLRGQAGAEP